MAPDLPMRLMAQGLAEGLGAVPARGMDMLLTGFIDEHESIECLSVLNARGVQITGTVCSPAKLRKRFIYEPARLGADHSLKEHFLPLRAGLSKFTTQPCISLASGNRRITLSVRCADRDGRPCILCADYRPPGAAALLCLAWHGKW